MTARLLPVAAGLLLLAWRLSLAGEPAPETQSDVQDVVFLGQPRPLLLRLHLRIDGRPYQAVHRAAWDDYLKALFGQLDQNGDGFLSEAEARRLPPPPQLSGGSGSGRPTNLAFNFRVVDADGNGKLDLAELVAFYRDYGGAGLSVTRVAPPPALPPGVGGGAGVMAGPVAPATAAVSEALFNRLDTNRDGRLSQDELAAAEAVLMPLDGDGDELLTPAELTGRPAPATQPNRAIFGVRRAGPSAAGSPFIFLGQGANREDVEKFAKQPPDVELLVRLGETGPGEAPLEVLTPGDRPAPAAPHVQAAGDGSLLLTWGQARIGLRANEGRPSLVPRLRQQYVARFHAADTGGKGFLTLKDAQAAGFFPAQFSLLDRNGDGRLTEAELTAYLDQVQERQARALTSGVAVLVSEEGHGLFELLDRNRDGKLSLRELRSASRLLAQLGREKDGLSREDMPRTYEVAVGLAQAGFNRVGGHGIFSPRGMPLLALDWSRPDLVWFHKMDRNQDGDVSPREFLGTAADFRRIDTDADGLISLDEAVRAGKLFPKPGRAP